MVCDRLPCPIYAVIMSTYLLLRNNKEAGPFTYEEIKELSLKPFDLLWVVGKSAAWRYPGEIPELKSFAPPVPEQVAELQVKKALKEENQEDLQGIKKTEPANVKSRENTNKQNTSPSKSIYVNLPADKSQSGISHSRAIYDANLQSDRDPAYDFSDLLKRKPNRAIRLSGKFLWVSAIIILFGTGILTGFFISDRRKIFSGAENDQKIRAIVKPAVTVPKKEVLPAEAKASVTPAEGSAPAYVDPSVNKLPVSGKSIRNAGKKNQKNNLVPADSLNLIQAHTTAVTDSVQKQNTGNITELLYQKIKAHPESYVSLVTGQYTTGIFGGISSIPITVTNNSTVMMDQVVVNITYIQNNEKIFKTESISFNDLEPGETVTIKAPKSTRGVKITSRIHLINIQKLDLNYSN